MEKPKNSSFLKERTIFFENEKAYPLIKNFYKTCYNLAKINHLFLLTFSILFSGIINFKPIEIHFYKNISMDCKKKFQFMF